MNNAPQSSKLDEELDTLWATAYNRGLDHAQQIYYSINDNDKVKHKSKSQILALLEEVIGEEDEPYPVYGNPHDQQAYDDRENLRAEQRLRKDAL